MRFPSTVGVRNVRRVVKRVKPEMAKEGLTHGTHGRRDVYRARGLVSGPPSGLLAILACALISGEIDAAERQVAKLVATPAGRAELA